MLFDYNVVLDSLPLYFGGVLVTLKLLIIALAVGLLLAGIVALTVFAGPVMRFAAATADQLYNPSLYLHAVLERQEGTK